MKPPTLNRTFAAIAIICFVAIAGLWFAVAGRVILWQGGIDPEGKWLPGDPADWTMVLVPRTYFLLLYLLTACAIIGALWFRVRGRKRPLIDRMLMLAVAGGVVGITLVLLLYRPPMPASWSQLRTGMTQKEVEDLVGWEAVWRRDRGVHLQHGAPMFGAGGVWELDLTYDGYAMSSVRYGGGRYGNARLKRATATYYHQFRLLGSQPIELP